MPTRWTRRQALGLGVLGAAAAVGGCSGPQEELPVVPTDPRDPRVASTVADLEPLLQARERAHLIHGQAAAITEARGTASALVERVVPSLLTQAEVLDRVLRAGSVPLPAPPVFRPDPPDQVTATATPDDAAVTSAGPQEERERQDRVLRQLAALAASCAEDVSEAALAELSQVSSANLAMLTALAGQRGGLAGLLGLEVDWPPLEGPTGAVAADLLVAFRPAVYGFEVLAARVGEQVRTTYENALQPLRRITRQLTTLAGEAAPPAPLGYGLPSDLDTAPARRQLAQTLLSALPPTIIAAAGAHTGDAPAVTGTVRMLAETITIGRRWELPLEAFPGMTVP